MADDLIPNDLIHRLAERMKTHAEGENKSPLKGQPFKVWMEIARLAIEALGIETVKLRLQAIENVEHAHEHEQILADSKPLDLDPLSPVEKATRVWGDS